MRVTYEKQQDGLHAVLWRGEIVGKIVRKGPSGQWHYLAKNPWTAIQRHCCGSFHDARHFGRVLWERWDGSWEAATREFPEPPLQRLA